MINLRKKHILHDPPGLRLSGIYPSGGFPMVRFVWPYEIHAYIVHFWKLIDTDEHIALMRSLNNVNGAIASFTAPRRVIQGPL